MAQCTAKSKRTGQQCRRPAMTGRTTCYMHGGKTPRGAALPQTTHGRYSKDLPARLADRYEEARNDPDLLNLNAEIQLTYALLSEALKGMDRGESGALWRALHDAWDQYQAASQNNDTEASRTTLDAIGGLITRGVADAAARSEVRGIIDRRRKLVESEGKRRT